MATPGVEPEEVLEAEVTPIIKVLAEVTPIIKVLEGVTPTIKVLAEVTLTIKVLVEVAIDKMPNLLARCARNRHIILASVESTQILNPRKQGWWNVECVRIVLEQRMKVNANSVRRATRVVESTCLTYVLS